MKCIKGLPVRAAFFILSGVAWRDQALVSGFLLFVFI